jgi:hypothetical protein
MLYHSKLFTLTIAFIIFFAILLCLAIRKVLQELNVMKSLRFFILLVAEVTPLLMNHPLKDTIDLVGIYIVMSTVGQSRGYIKVGGNIDYLNIMVLEFI